MADAASVTGLPDFRTMTNDEIHAWMEEVGFVQVMRLLPNVARDLPPARVAPIPEEYVHWFEGPTKVVACRLPEKVVAALDEIAGDTKDGRAGLIKVALFEWLERRKRATADNQEAA